MNKNLSSRESIHHNYSAFGFTLAETLITLVIIGVVAALTVPTLIVKYQKEQTLTQLKKTYSALSQTTQRAIADNGPINTWELGTANNTDDAKRFINTYLAPYLSVMKPPTTKNEGNWYNYLEYSNGTQSQFSSGFVRFYLNDGASVTGRIGANTDTSKYLPFIIDINGDKKPNKLGRDMFEYDYIILAPGSYYTGKFLPNGLGENRTSIISSSCNKNEGAGWKCAALIMKDDWQIKNDYPW